MTGPSSEDIERFKECLTSGTRYSKEYWALDAQVKITFECPTKYEIDLIIGVLDKLQREGAVPAKVSRICHTARIRAYLRRLRIGEMDLNFPPIIEVARQHTVSAFIEILAASLDFADEALYNILRRFAGDFKRHLSMLFSGPSGELSEVEKFVARKLEEGLPQPRKAEDADDGPTS